MGKKKINPLTKVVMVMLIIVMLSVGFMEVFSGDSKNKQSRAQQFINHHKQDKNIDTATGDTSVETLKTLTAELSNVEAQNKKIIAENNALKGKNSLEVDKLRRQLMQKLQDKLNSVVITAQKAQKELLQKELQNNVRSQSGSKQQIENARENIDGSKFPIGGSQVSVSSQRFSWITDMQVSAMPNDKRQPSTISQLASILNPGVGVDASNESTNPNYDSGKKKPKPIPYYTMPIGSTLIGAVLMEPLVGRIPINGKVPDPYHFKVIIGAKNLAANGIDIPSNVQGIVATGYATGDMLRSCAMGNITTMTFVFPDGRISTTKAKDGTRVGYISATSGDPCLAGSFHTNAAEYLGGSSILAGLQGYASALSQAQTLNTTSNSNGNAPSVSTIVKDGNKYALGKGVAAGTQNAQNWWNARAQNSFDYVYVPNISVAGKLTKVDIHVEQQIDIDYDKVGRKVSFDHSAKNYQTKNLD